MTKLSQSAIVELGNWNQKFLEMLRSPQGTDGHTSEPSFVRSVQVVAAI